jgi:AcrR family transcriptional regulator
LEQALLDAAWAQLVEQGYATFTMDAVAARAGTSRAVLYRRWSDKQEFFMTLKPVSNATIEEIVDTIFLPLCARAGASLRHDGAVKDRRLGPLQAKGERRRGRE